MAHDTMSTARTQTTAEYVKNWFHPIKQSDRSPKVVATFSATNFSSYII